MFALAVAAALGAAQAGAPAPAVDPVRTDIAALEQQWGEAFVKRDFDFLERIVAPEFQLVGARPDGSLVMVGRDEWMKNARAYTHDGFEVQTTNVNRVGDTAVASAQGLWTITTQAGAQPERIRFFVTDTWVRRNGQWQVISRHSTRLPRAPWPPSPQPVPTGN